MSKGNRSRSRRHNRAANGARPATSRGMVDANQSVGGRQTLSAFAPTEPRWWANQGEWVRGKAELLWETRLSPFFGWLRTIPERFTGAWGNRVRITRRQTRGNSLIEWTWEEHGARFLRQAGRVALLLGISAAIVIGLSFAAMRVANAVSRTPPSLSGNIVAAATATPTSNPDITIHTGGVDTSPTPTAPAYTLGLWVSNSTPAVGEAVTIYAKVCQNGGTPIPNTPVTISVYGHSQTVTTNADGIASLVVNANSPADQPVNIDGAATVSGLALSNGTFFTPI